MSKTQKIVLKILKDKIGVRQNPQDEAGVKAKERLKGTHRERAGDAEMSRGGPLCWKQVTEREKKSSSPL